MTSSNESSDAVTLPSSSTKASKSKRPERSDEDDKAVLRFYLFPTEAMDFCSVEEASKEYETTGWPKVTFGIGTQQVLETSIGRY